MGKTLAGLFSLSAPTPNRRRSAVIILLAAGLFGSAAAFLARSQTPVAGRVKNFVVPDYDLQNRKRAVLIGEEAEAAPNNIWNVRNLKIESYDADEKAAWLVEAPACLFDNGSKIATSTGPLSVRSADDRFQISGQGFEWRQADQQLIISNAVRTLIRDRGGPTNQALAAIGRQNLEVTAERFHFRAREYQAAYHGEVRVREQISPGATNPPMNLDCGLLLVQMPAGGGGLEYLQAEHDVVFQQGQSRATGGKAVYAASNEVVRISVAANWETELAAGKAEALELDRRRDLFVATGNTFTRLKPSRAAAQSGTGTNDIMEIFADSLTAQRLAPAREEARITAAGQVVVTRGEQRATGNRALYLGTAEDGRLEITGNARWQIPGTEGQADTLIFDRRQNEFWGQGNGYIRTAREPGNREKAVEIWADSYRYQTNGASLKGAVRLQDQEWKLSCAEMTLLSQPAGSRWQTVLAREGVTVEQRPASAAQTPWRLTSRQARLDFRADGRLVEKVVAENQVLIEPAQPPAPGSQGFSWKLGSDRLTLYLAAQTNRLEKAVAENNIRLEQVFGTPVATGEKWTFASERLTLQISAQTGDVEAAVGEQNVRVEMIEVNPAVRERVAWRLTSQRAVLRLAAGPERRIESAEAEQGVRVVQLATNSAEHAWELLSERAGLKMAASNRIEQVTATDQVRITQGATGPAPPMKLRCENLRMDLTPTNTIRQLRAVTQVVLEQGSSRATGAEGLFDAAANEVRLTGQPSLVYADEKGAAGQPPRKVRVEGAEELIWNRLSNRFKGRGLFRITPEGVLKASPAATQP